jgi:hypothetical protein
MDGSPAMLQLYAFVAECLLHADEILVDDTTFNKLCSSVNRRRTRDELILRAIDCAKIISGRRDWKDNDNE